MKKNIKRCLHLLRPNSYLTPLLLFFALGTALYACLQISGTDQLHPPTKAEIQLQPNRKATREDSIIRRQEYLALTLWAYHATQTAALDPEHFVKTLSPLTKTNRPHQPDTGCVANYWPLLQQAAPDDQQQVEAVIDRIYSCVTETNQDKADTPTTQEPIHLFDLRLTTLWHSLKPERFLNAKLTFQGAEVNRENSPQFRTFAEAYSHCLPQVRHETLTALPNRPSNQQLAQAWTQAKMAYDICLSQANENLFPLPEPQQPVPIPTP